MIREKKVGKQTYHLIMSTAWTRPTVLKVCKSTHEAEDHLKRLRWSHPQFFL